MYEGQISDLYFNYVSRTYGNVLLWRGFTVDGDPAPAVESFRDRVAIYPLEIEISDEEIEAMEAAEINGEIDSLDPSLEDPADGAIRFVSLSGSAINTIHSSDFGFFEEVDELVQEGIELTETEIR